MSRQFWLIALIAFAPLAFASTLTVNCTPTAFTNSITLGSSIGFVNASGTGSFSCSDASLGSVVLSDVTVSIFSDYTTGNGTNSDPVDNSAGFTFTSSTGTWALAHGSPGLPLTTMNLNTGLTVFTIGNASSSADSFSNTTRGGLAGTTYAEPIVDSQTGSLVGVFTIPVSAFVDAGGFTNGLSSARATVTYTFTALTTPEPASMMFIGSTLLALGLIRRRRK